MDGTPYFSKTNAYKDKPSTDDIFLSMPEYLRHGIGKYGSEISGTLDISNNNEPLKTLKTYIENLHLPTHKTYHTFEDCIPTKEHHAVQTIKYGDLFVKISKMYPNQIVAPIVSMNELYVSCLGADGSDRVFETPHIDGLFAWLPWCVVLRGVVAIQGNRNIHTIFPLSQNIYTLETGEYVAFDYNRSIHYIRGSAQGASVGTKSASVGAQSALETVGTQGALETVGAKSALDKRTRIILKLHYLVHPEWFPVWLSRLYIGIHGKYNAFLRGLFLQSQITQLSLDKSSEQEHPPTYLQSFISYGINHTTTVYVKLFLVGLFLTNWLNNLLSSFVANP